MSTEHPWEHPMSQRLAEALREYRDRRWLSVADAAAAAGISAASWSYYEHGERWPSRPVLARLRALGAWR